jgi:5-methylthioadenosine/S-adenosylhomocysteine deaminase
MLNSYSLSGLTLVTPETVVSSGSIQVDQKKLGRLGGKSKHDIRFPAGCAAFPAIVNLHDHFNGNYLPKVGPSNGDYYLNWSHWEKDLRNSNVIKVERAKTTVDQRYMLSAYKNLFSGVTTVNDHWPHELNEPFIPRLPIRVIRDYALAHECSSFDLKWGDGIQIEHERAVQKGVPFITHLEEGFDEETQRGVEILEELGCFDDHDIFIHCIGLSDEDIAKIAKAGATVGWCPQSNVFMFNLTCKIRKIMAAGINVGLGTDTTATGSVNILEEMRFAREMYRKMYGEDLSARVLTEMVTVNPAKAFRMQNEIGSITEGKLADVLVIRLKKDDPYESLVDLKTEDIELLIMEGAPILGSKSHGDLFAARGGQFSAVKIRGKDMLVRGDPAALMEGIRAAVGFKKVLDFIPLDN